MVTWENVFGLQLRLCLGLLLFTIFIISAYSIENLPFFHVKFLVLQRHIAAPSELFLLTRVSCTEIEIWVLTAPS